MSEQNKKNDEDEDLSIKPKEIILFAAFGIIPILILYTFASGGLNDPKSEAFEYERKLLIAECLEQLDDRQDCRQIIDERYLECYDKFAIEDGSVTKRDELQRCVTQREDDKYRLPPVVDENAPAGKVGEPAPQAGSDSVQ